MSRSWLLLVHQLPSNPSAFRVRIWRRLQQLGAVAIKDAVYVLPRREETVEDFNWLAREIIDGGGSATIFQADTLDDNEIIALFQDARNADYSAVVTKCGEIETTLRDTLDTREPSLDELRDARTELDKLKKRMSELAKIDFFHCPGRTDAQSAINHCAGIIASLEDGIAQPQAEEGESLDTRAYTGRIWVTRKDAGIDRVASAWLIRRFIDPNARFEFVDDKAGFEGDALFFDMFGGEFTHTQDRCTFEVLMGKFCLGNPALQAMAEIVHDLDLKDSKFGRPEAAGVEALLEGVIRGSLGDADAIERGVVLMDSLFASFGGEPGSRKSA